MTRVHEHNAARRHPVVSLRAAACGAGLAAILSTATGCTSALNRPVTYREHLEEGLPNHLPAVLGDLESTERPVYNESAPAE